MFSSVIDTCIIKNGGAISEQSEKLVNIILPDLLNYLEMMESGEIIEKRLEKNRPREQRKEKLIKYNRILLGKINALFFQKKVV